MARHETMKKRNDEPGCEDVESFHNAAMVTQAIFEMRCISSAPDLKLTTCRRRKFRKNGLSCQCNNRRHSPHKVLLLMEGNWSGRPLSRYTLKRTADFNTLND